MTDWHGARSAAEMTMDRKPYDPTLRLARFHAEPTRENSDALLRHLERAVAEADTTTLAAHYRVRLARHRARHASAYQTAGAL